MRILRRSFRRRDRAKAPAHAALRVEALESRTVADAGSRAFITESYRDLLRRDAEPTTVAALEGFLDGGSVTRAQIATNLATSVEYRSLQVQDAYQGVLQRGADVGGLAGGVGYLGAGGSVPLLEAILAASDEYFVQRAGGANAAYVGTAYQDLLGRAADPGGAAFWTQALSVGLPRWAFTTALAFSTESLGNVAQAAYQQLLGRVVDAGTATVIAGWLQQGGRPEQFVASILASEEYAPGGTPAGVDPARNLTSDEVGRLLRRASAASGSQDAIIAVVDRNGRVLGVRAEAGVSPLITGNAAALTYAVDGALAKARTAAYFANNQAPLTSRTVRFISQSTITQREVDSNPSITDPNSPFRGPGFVAPVGIAAHFPPNVPNTPLVDLFGIEHTNRDSIVHPGTDHIKGTADDVALAARFNINPTFVPAGQELFAPESYGFVSGILPTAQSRGIATLPGGIPLYKNGVLVGGIGVFFPGTTGSASEENSALDVRFNAALPDRSLEAEYIAFAAAGGSSGAGASVGVLGGVAPLAGFDLPFGRIDLVGVTLDIYGPGGSQGVSTLLRAGQAYGAGSPDSGRNLAVDPANVALRGGRPVPEGWLVMPHDGVGLTAADVTRLIGQGIGTADQTRAAIRLPLGSRTRMVFAVTDLRGEVLGLYRMPDATVFSIDVAVAKARNVAYYASADLQAIDRAPGLPTGVAFTNRTFRYLAQPRYPEGVDGTPPAVFSQLLDGGADLRTALNLGAPLPASGFQSVLGYDAFNPGTNFRDPTDVLNQNGVVFFPGSAAVYRPGLAGGFGVSGDGVDQDDVVTSFGAQGFEPPGELRADFYFVGGVRLPYHKFPRNPFGE